MLTTAWTFSSLIMAGMAMFAASHGTLSDEDGRPSNFLVALLIAFAPLVFIALAIKSLGEKK